MSSKLKKAIGYGVGAALLGSALNTNQNNTPMDGALRTVVVGGFAYAAAEDLFGDEPRRHKKKRH